MKRKIDETHPLSYFLKSAREDLDLTQRDVMKLTGINNKTLSGYENGVAEPDFKSLAALAKLYQISFDELLSINANKNISDYFLTNNEFHMLTLFRNFTEEKQCELIVQMQALSDFLNKNK